MPGQWKNDEMIYVVPGQNIPKKDDVINVQSLFVFCLCEKNAPKKSK